MTPDQQNRLLDLFVACSQQTATEAENRELQDSLRTDIDARRLWFLYQDIDFGLKCLTQTIHDTADLQGVGLPVRKSADVGPGVHTPASIEGSSHASLFARRKPAMAVVATLCLSTMVMLGIHTWGLPSDEFTVQSPTHGTTLAISEQRGKLIALHFLLKTECPFCLKLTNDYSRLSASEPDVLHVFLKPDSAEEIKVWAGKISQVGLKEPPVIYRDPNARLAKEFGIPDGYEFHGRVTRYPALVLLDRSGKELFRYVGKNNTDRMKPADFIARLAMVTDHK